MTCAGIGRFFLVAWRALTAAAVDGPSPVPRPAAGPRDPAYPQYLLGQVWRDAWAVTFGTVPWCLERARWGVTKADGSPIASDAQAASLLLPMGRFGPAFLAYPNFQVFLEWNQSIVYSTSAAYLATRIVGTPAMHRGSKQIVPFASAQIREVQTLLVRRGHDVGKIDGFLGLKSRAAVKAEQVKLGLPADSYPTPELVQRLQGR